MQFHESLQSVAQALVATRTPVVAFGQTVFWDEPLKVILLNAVRAQDPELPFTLGIHDVDFFSKLPGARSRGEAPPFMLVPRNDGSTRELWAAVAELAALFGGETPVTLADFASGQLQRDRLIEPDQDARASLIDQLTEAWGWRAIAYTGDDQPLACQTGAAALLPALRELWQWGMAQTIALLAEEPARNAAHTRAARLLTLLEQSAPPLNDCPPGEESITCLYRALLPQLITAVAGAPAAGLTVASTFAWFQFNAETIARPRFAPLTRFLDGGTRERCLTAYNRAVEGTGIYPLSRFGEGALPFDAVIPGRGRATVRVLGRELWLHFPEYDRKVGFLPAPEVGALAQLLGERFGPGVALVGKALLLPVMICSEAALALSETASAYLPRTRQWVGEVRAAGVPLELKPLIRLRYPTLDTLGSMKVRWQLPPHLEAWFSHDAQSGSVDGLAISAGWRTAVAQADARLQWLAEHPGHDDLFGWLAAQAALGAPFRLGGSDSGADPSEAVDWARLRRQYQNVRQTLREHGNFINEERERIRQLHEERRELAATVREVEAVIARGKGVTTATAQRAEALAQREAYVREIERVRGELRQVAHAIQARLRLIAEDQLSAQRAALERQGTRARAALIRSAVLTIRGLQRSHHRPCAWWLPLLDESGTWFRALAKGTEAAREEWPTPADAV